MHTQPGALSASRDINTTRPDAAFRQWAGMGVLKLDAPVQASKAILDPSQTAFVQDYLMHWVDNADPGSQFDQAIKMWRAGPLKGKSDREVLDFLFSNGFDGLLHIADGEVLAHSFFQKHAGGSELHRMSVFVPECHRGKGLAHLSSLDLIDFARDIGCKTVILGRYNGNDATRHLIDHVRAIQSSIDVNVDQQGVVKLLGATPRQTRFEAPSAMSTSDAAIHDLRMTAYNICKAFGREVAVGSQVIPDAKLATVNVSRGIQLRVFMMVAGGNVMECDVTVWSGRRLVACTSLGQSFQNGEPVIGIHPLVGEVLTGKGIYSVRPHLAEAFLGEALDGIRSGQVTPSLIGTIASQVRAMQVSGRGSVAQRLSLTGPLGAIRQALPSILDRVDIVHQNEFTPMGGSDGYWKPWHESGYLRGKLRHGIEVHLFDHRAAGEFRALGHSLRLRVFVSDGVSTHRIAAIVGVESQRQDRQFQWSILPRSLVNELIVPALKRAIGEEALAPLPAESI